MRCSTDDPEIIRLTDAADRAIRQGAIVTARKFLDDAVSGSRRPAARSTLPRTWSSRSALPMLRSMCGAPMPPSLAFDYKAAADDYAKAFELVEKWDDKLQLELQEPGGRGAQRVWRTPPATAAF